MDPVSANTIEITSVKLRLAPTGKNKSKKPLTTVSFANLFQRDLVMSLVSSLAGTDSNIEIVVPDQLVGLQ